MPNPLGSVVRCLRRLTAVPHQTEDDAALLDRFVSARDETAFATLVRRHGALVLGTAYRLLADSHAAEDVFQATFLLLARKTPSLRGPGSLAGWLHGVAWRLAMKLQTQAGRRRRHEARKVTGPGGAPRSPNESEAEMSGDEPSAAVERRETRRLIEEELGHLPDRYRTALVLCYLEGLTNEEAAARLACPVGSVKSRLSRGRDLLHSRLSRRGVMLSVPLLAAGLTEAAASAAVSPELLNATVRAAATFAAGQLVRDVGVSAGAAELVQGALRAMTLHKLKLTAATIAILAGLAGLGMALAPRAAVNEARGDEPPAVFIVPVETPQIKADREAVAKGNTQFALDLYKKLAEEKQGKNLFLSPYSISTALAMTYTGARTTTASEMEKTLHFPVPQERLHPAFAGLVGRLQANKKDQGYQLAVANALWGQKGYPWLPEFLKTTHTNYDAGLRQLDFAETETARKTINGWIEEKTQDKIKDMIPTGVLDRTTKLVLTNAIYFKGDWLHEFDKKLTKEEPFLGAAKADLKASLMHRTGGYGYLDGDGFQVLELPYKGDNLSMVVLLPKKADGLTDLEHDLTGEKLTGALAKLHSTEVVVSLPKFKLTEQFNLGDTLAALGMPTAFDSTKADFSGMDGERNLRIAAVLHKAFVDVNEEGTEAGAATVVAVAPGSAIKPRPKPEFRADHPFLFLIRDKQTGSILFLGRLTDPAK